MNPLSRQHCAINDNVYVYFWFMFMKCLKQLHAARKIVECHKLRTADIKKVFTAQRMTERRSVIHPSYPSSVLVSVQQKITKIISDQKIIMVILLEFGCLLQDRGCFDRNWVVEIKNAGW